MRLTINLASEPFRRDRHIIAALSAACAVLTCSVIILVTLAYSARSRSSEMRAEVDRLTRAATQLGSEQGKLDGRLRLPANSAVLERSVLLNTLLERKAISWTRIFEDLEKVLPANVRLISIRLPRINGQQQGVTLDMIVGSQTPEPVLNFLRRLEGSPLFGPAAVSSVLAPNQNEPLYRYRVSVNYAQKL
jgi:type IV pilus assembly protein PilN